MGFRIISGDATGLVKSAVLPGGKVTAKIGHQAAGHGVCEMVWGHKEEWLLAAHATGEVVKINESLESSLDVGVVESPVGLGLVDQHTAVVCSSTGRGVVLAVPHSSQSGNVKSEFNVEGPVSAFAMTQSTIAAGGEENDIALFQLRGDGAQSVFKAKNVRHNFLNLRVPVWPTAVAFVPQTETQFAVVSAYHTVRLYDTKAQRRPVMEFTMGESRFNCLVFSHMESVVLAGNSTGEVFCADLRKQAKVHAYKGVGGSVRAIALHPLQDTFAVASLDRWARLYSVRDKAPQGRIYLKQQLTSILIAKKEADTQGIKRAGSSDMVESGRPKKRSTD